MSRQFGNLLLYCTLVFVANGKSTVDRLVGGAGALSPKYQPYTVALKYDNEYYTCSGAIISPTKILTTASCVASCVREDHGFGPKNCLNLTIYAGSPSLSSGGNVYHIKSIKVPDDYVVGKFANDIAVVTLSTAIKYSDKQRPIGLPDKDIVDDSSGVTSGWGVKFGNDELKDNIGNFKVDIITPAKCSEEYFNKIEVSVDINDFCGVQHAHAGFCNGHSGSPLIQNGKIIGILAWGIAGCSAREYPDGYTNVYKHLEFIKKELQ